jgi:hypothetical protein
MDTFGQIECNTSVCPSPDNFQINNLQNEVLISFNLGTNPIALKYKSSSNLVSIKFFMARVPSVR